MKVFLEIEGKDVELFIVKENDETDYVRIAKALLERLTDEQLEELIHIRGNKQFIFFNELVKQYKFKGFFSKETGNCICGVSISSQYLIRNIDTNKDYIIGSVCKANWYVKDCVSYYCQFCSRRKANNENCINCQGKKDLREIFNNMKKVLTDKVDFGKYKDKMTYFKLVFKQPSYCNWLVNESNISENKKNKIRMLL